MRIANYYSNQDIRIEDRPVPKIGPGELLIRVEASGICGTDVIEWYRRDKTPLVLGHEIAGEIVEVGAGLKQYHQGQRISASHHVPCGRCSFCLSGHQTVCETLRRTRFDPGGFAEYLRLPAINVEAGGVYILPQRLTYEQATFIEPVACILRAQRLAELCAGKSVLVMGCGLSGLLHIQLAKLKGAAFIAAADINDYRLACAGRFGADAPLRADKQDVAAHFLRLNRNKAADLVIVATAATSAHAQALQAVERAGTVLFFAATEEGVTIPLSVNDVFWRTEVSLISSYAATPQEHVAALELIAAGKIRVAEMVTHRFGLDKIQEGFRLVAEARDSLKVIIEPQK